MAGGATNEGSSEQSVVETSGFGLKSCFSDVHMNVSNCIYLFIEGKLLLDKGWKGCIQGVQVGEGGGRMKSLAGKEDKEYLIRNCCKASDLLFVSYDTQGSLDAVYKLIQLPRLISMIFLVML